MIVGHHSSRVKEDMIQVIPVPSSLMSHARSNMKVATMNHLATQDLRTSAHKESVKSFSKNFGLICSCQFFYTSISWFKFKAEYL